MNNVFKSKALEIFKQAVNSQENPLVQEWKQQGGKVLGYLYSYIPVELITSAGLLPFHIRGTGSTGTELSDARFTQVNCSFVRHCLNLALEGEMDFIDGLVAFDQCDHTYRMYHNWIAKVETPFSYFINVPKKRGKEQTELYRNEIMLFKKKLEGHFGVEISDDKLRDAIKLHNETRCLQRQLYKLKKKKNPPITGADTLAVMVSGSVMPKEKYNQLLKELLEDLENREGQNSDKVRLMVVGGELDNPDLVEVIESQGGLVVSDALIFGTRTMWNDVVETGDPIDAIAGYYLDERPACPRIIGTGFDRYAFIKKIATEFAIDGIIFVRHPFCDMWGFEKDVMSNFLKKEQLPHLKLETEYVLSGVGQMKTRVQAFLETLQEAKS